MNLRPTYDSLIIFPVIFIVSPPNVIMSKWWIILICFFVLSCVTARFTSKELTTGPLRFTDGRQSQDSELARSVAANPHQYWSSLTDSLNSYVREKSEQTLRQWNQTVAQGSGLKGRVSTDCLDVLEYMIQHPLEQEWSAKSKLRQVWA